MTYHSSDTRKGPGADGVPQRKIGGRYLLLERIDKGRCSEVLLALDEKEGRQVAAKIGLPRQDRDFVRTVFRNEARALEIGAHPNVVKLLDADARAGEPFLIMEYVPGPTLHALAYEGRVDPRAALRMVSGMLEALEAMHAQGLVHRDLKPKNIMLGAGRDVKLIDFGFASVPGLPDFTSGSQRRFGNPIYSPPESTNGIGDPRADIFSVGMMMYELLSRRCSCRLLDLALLSGVHRAPFLLAAEAGIGRINHGAAEVIENAVRRDPAERFQTAGEMRRRVEKILESPPA